MEKILELAKKSAEAAEVFTVTSEETSVSFEANRLKHVQGKQSNTTSLRVVKNGRIGYAMAAGDIDAAELVNMAVETARFGMEARFEFPSQSDYPQVEVYDKKVTEVTPEQMVALGEELIAPLRAGNPEIVCQSGAGRGIITVRLMNSRGGAAEYVKTIFSIGVEGTIVKGTDMLFVGDGESSCHPVMETKNILKTVLQQLEYAKTQAAVTTKQMPVIFTPDGVASAMIPALMAAFNGKTVLEGASPVGQRLGQQVFSTHFSLWDDAIAAYRPETRPCDDEGVPSRRTPLVENGVVKNILYDLQTAALSGKQSTGSGSRGRGLPAPSPSSFVIMPGAISFEDMLHDIKEGLVIEQLMGADQGNVLGGDFSGNVLLGYKVENGRITGRVKDTMVSGNIYQLLKDAVIGREARWVGGSLQIPHFFCPSVSVASK